MKTNKQRMREWLDNATPEQHEKLLRAITDLAVEDIMEMSDEELRAELIEDGIDPDALAAKGRAIINELLAARAREGAND